ncbi:MAG TPA: hypothetical protein VEO95_03965, partial [Chthoniobacteraceae bacterium]|nr:hypothetical protein [Chthoniobacteraceae bacterium]
MKSKPSSLNFARQRSRGSTTVVALLMLSTLATLGATMLFSISARYNTMTNNVAWRQAINA